jgi:hypothetical protein
MKGTLNETEYAVLRETIRQRGTTRMVLVPVTFIGWGAIALVILVVAPFPLAAVCSLAVLAAGFESIHALHVGTERIGRYLQVRYEAEVGGPRWETTALAVGPALPGGGIDPLFSVIFSGAGIVNLLLVVLPRPTVVEVIVLGLIHLVFLVRVVRARGAATRQRAVELESFKTLLSRDHPNP